MARSTSSSAQGEFHIACRHDIFDEKELAILMRFGKHFAALASGERQPATAGQQHFVSVCCGREQPGNEYERVWMKYQHRLEWDKENGAKYREGSFEIQLDEGFGGSREEVKKMRGALLRDMNRRWRGM